MGYFDGLTDASFKRDAAGRSLFYPWGVFGAGYITTDEQRQKLRSSLRKMYMVMLGVIILVQMIFGSLVNLGLLAIYFPSYWLWARRTTASLTKSDEKLTVRQSYTSSAKSHNWPSLVLLEMISLAFVGMGLFLASSFLGYATALFFGACSVAIAYMIVAKARGGSGPS